MVASVGCILCIIIVGSRANVKQVCNKIFENAKKYSAESLAKGLMFLSEHRVESVIPNSEDIQVLYGRLDTMVTPEWTLKLKDFLPKAEFKERPKAGHWPPMLLL